MHFLTVPTFQWVPPATVLLRALIPLLLLATALVVQAQTLPAPQQPVVLSISGNIGQRNTAQGADFDLVMLDALPQTEVTTDTPWTDRPHTYSGVELQTLLKRVQASDDQLVLIALNQYWIELDPELIRRYPALLASSRDGQPMRVRDKGPLWLVFPLDDHPELNKPAVLDQMIWQVREIIVK